MHVNNSSYLAYVAHGKMFFLFYDLCTRIVLGHHLTSNINPWSSIKISGEPVVYVMNTTDRHNFNTICSVWVTKLRQAKIVLLDWANLLGKCIFNRKRVHTLPVRWQRSTHSRLCRPMEAAWGTSVFPVMSAHEDGGDKDPGAPHPLIPNPRLSLPVLTETALIVSLVPQAQITNKQAFLSTRIGRRGQCQDTWSDPLHTHTRTHTHTHTHTHTKQEKNQTPLLSPGPSETKLCRRAKEHWYSKLLWITVHYI